MSNYKIISKEVVSQGEVLDIIKKKSKDNELTYREEKTKDYLKKISNLKMSDFKKAKTDLIGLEIPKLDDENIIKILDIMPTNGTQLRSIISHSGTVLVDENVTKILDVLKNYGNS